MTTLKIIKDSITLKKEILNFKKRTIGLVPTLGGLHKGHIELIRLAKRKCDVVIVSIFLNPLQFNSSLDLKKYPNNFLADKKKIKKENIQILYAPSIKEIFPNKKIKRIKASKISRGLCGKYRKGHFDGVATVIKSLFNQVSPKFAFFGLKDFQQILVIKDLIKKYKLQIKIVTMPTVRHSNGLAYSSRNSQLSDKQKKVASFLFKTIKEISFEAKKNFNNLNYLKKIGKKKLIKYGFKKIDYLEIYNENNLSNRNLKKNNLRVFVAAILGKTRLIDNYKN